MTAEEAATGPDAGRRRSAFLLGEELVEDVWLPAHMVRFTREQRPAARAGSPITKVGTVQGPDEPPPDRRRRPSRREHS
jgi:hypothetical protein